MVNGRTLGAERLDQAADVGHRRVGAAGLDGRAWRHEVALCRDAKESCLALFGCAVVRHFDPSYTCRPAAPWQPALFFWPVSYGLGGRAKPVRRPEERRVGEESVRKCR